MPCKKTLNGRCCFETDTHSLDRNPNGFDVFTDDPSRIVGIMEVRANAYQLMLWDALRTQDIVVPGFSQLRVEILKHTEEIWAGVGRTFPGNAATNSLLT